MSIGFHYLLESREKGVERAIQTSPTAIKTNQSTFLTPLFLFTYLFFALEKICVTIFRLTSSIGSTSLPDCLFV